MSVQLASKLDAETLKHFEYVVIDEFHHAHAQSYRNLLSKLDPEILLGMTATPQRGDGVNVAEFFGNRITAELSLASALISNCSCHLITSWSVIQYLYNPWPGETATMTRQN